MSTGGQDRDADFIGVVNSGGGKVEFNGVSAFGPDSSATGTPAAPARSEPNRASISFQDPRPSGDGAPAADPGAPAAARHAAAQGDPARAAEDGDPGDVTRNVFVVYGRDDEARRAVFDLLRTVGLRPLEWEELVRWTGETAPFIGRVVAAAPSAARAALVLLTPDDVVRLHPSLHSSRGEPAYESEPRGQARPNVLLELGMVLMAYPERTVIVEMGGLRPMSDLAGRNVIRFDGSLAAAHKIVQRLGGAGCAVNSLGADWTDMQPYQNLKAYTRAPC